MHVFTNAILVLLSLRGAPEPVPDAELGLPAEVAVMEEAIATWRRDVSFCCHFRLRCGRAASLESALRGEFDESRTAERSSAVSTASGRMSKDGPKVRFSLIYDGGQVELTPPKGLEATASKYSTNNSFDEMTDDKVEIRYHPKDENYGDAIYFQERGKHQPELKGTYAAGQLCPGRSPSPIAPLCAYDVPFLRMRPIEILGPKGVAEDADVTVREVDAEHLEISVVYRREPLWEYERRVLFWTKPSPPVMEYAMVRLDDNREKPPYRRTSSHSKLSDFVECPGGMVARRVLFVMEGLGGGVTFRLWESNDLGTRPCTADDFTIEVAPTTRLAGLKRPVKFERPFKIGLDEVSVDDIGDQIYQAPDVFDLPKAPSSQPNAAPRDSGWEGAVILVPRPG